MAKQVQDTILRGLQLISKTFFFSLYLVIQALVLIGEMTQKLLLSPFTIFMFLLRATEQGVISLAKLLIAISAKKEETVEEKPQESLQLEEVKPAETVTTVAEQAPEEHQEVVVEQPVQETVIDEPVQKPTEEVIPAEPQPAFWEPAKAAFILQLSRFKTYVVTHKEQILVHLKPSEIIVAVVNALKFVLSLPQIALQKVFKVVIKLLSKIAFLKAIIKQISASIRAFNRSWFAIFRLSFGSSFKYFIFGFLFCLVVLFFMQAYTFVTQLPSPQSIGKVNFPQSSHLFDRNGKLLYEFYHEENRTKIKLNDLPAHVYQASISIEDKTFYEHNGVAFVGGILRAAKDTLQTKELQGGSTLTQQLVKSALLSPERTIERKLKEIILALWTEQVYTKNQILEMYLNQVPYGGSSYGIEEAAKTYFGKSAKELTISEAALLAGLPQAPSLYSPFINPQKAINRRNEVLKLMQELGYITAKQRQVALNEKMNFLPPQTTIRAPHFVFYTKSLLEKEYGTKQVEEGGFNITTTLDLEIQEEAEKIVKEEIEKLKGLNVTNGAMIVMHPRTGEILAMVGSYDYFAQPYGAFNVTTAPRQPGSTLKPMLYSMAMQNGYTAASIIEDTPVVYRISDTEVYKPMNYDGNFRGRVTLRNALANSLNITAIRVVNAMGVTSFIEYGRRMGIDTWIDSSRYGMSIALGGAEVPLIDLAQVFSVFANEGYRVEPSPIKVISNSSGETISEMNPKKTKVMDEGVAFIISDILADNNARAQTFGVSSALNIPGYKVSVKTGTTNDKKDNLTVGYTGEYLVAVWVGNNDNTPMNPYLTSGVTGAAPLWNRMMTYLLQNKVKDPAAGEVKQPENVVARPCAGRTEYFVKGTENGSFCAAPVIKPPEKKN